MDIVYFLNSFPSVSESFVLNEIYGLERKGHNVAVFALNESGEEIEHEECAELDIPVYYAQWPEYRDMLSVVSPKILNTAVISRNLDYDRPKVRGLQLYYAKNLIDFVDSLDFNPDLIHAHFAVNDRLAVDFASGYLGIPWTVEAHAVDIFKQSNKKPAEKLLQRPDRVITVSRYNEEYLEDELGVKKPIDMVPVCVRPDKFLPEKHEEVEGRILTVARLVEKKGIRYGIEAVEKLQEDHPDIEYHIVGKGDLREELGEMVEQKGLRENVNFLGHVSDKRLIQEYDEASVFLLPCVIAENGDRDAMPMVLKEAMSMKTPCVSTGVSAVPELIQDGETGFIVESRDADGLAEATTWLLEDSEKRESFGKNGRKRIEKHFSLEKNVRELEAIFQRTVQ
jgi:glycosyltransferase involved in cell wall biosynthesis